jgi:hypothetical protein
MSQWSRGQFGGPSVSKVTHFPPKNAFDLSFVHLSCGTKLGVVVPGDGVEVGTEEDSGSDPVDGEVAFASSGTRDGFFSIHTFAQSHLNAFYSHHILSIVFRMGFGIP